MSAPDPPAAPPSPRAPAGEGGARDLAIDALRGVAILLVVAYHAGPLAWRLPPLSPTGWLEPPPLGAWWLAVPVLHFGYLGVHLFFVISGFCIHASCRLGRDVVPLDGARARRYGLRRLVRVAPPYWIALAIFGLGVPAVAAALGRQGRFASAGDLVAHALFVHNLSPRTIFGVNPAFWSMATEVQFYLTYPLVAWAIARLGMSRVLAAALLTSLGFRAAVLASFAPTVEHFMIYRVWLHGFFVPRWFEWILGCAVAEAVAGEGAWRLWERRRAMAAAGASMLALGMLCRVQVVIDKLFADLVVSLGFALLLGAWVAAERVAGVAGAAGAPGNPPAAAGGEARGRSRVARGLAVVGRRSYGTYLVHQPILDGDWLALGPRLAIAAVASALFSLGLERPFERLARRVGKQAR